MRYPITDFSRGEVSPTIEGRVDLDQYRRGARRMLNATILEEGGATRRPGTRYVTLAKYPDKRAHLVRFESSSGQPFVFEFGEGYIRFFKNGAPIAGVEVATPYLEEDLPRLKFVPVADVVFIFCQFYQTRRLEHYSDTIWKLKPHPPIATIQPTLVPSFEYGERPVTTVTPGATTGSGITFTAGAPQFLASDVGRDIRVFAGASTGSAATITGVTDSTHVVATITEAFADTSAIAATDWKMSFSPGTACTPSAAGPVGAIITLTLSTNGWRATDVGKRVFINGGLCFIFGVPSALVADAKILTVLSSATAAQPGAWTLEESAWSSFNGFPGAGEIYQDRLWAAGSIAQPDGLWATVSGDYDTFVIGTNADDGIAFRLSGSAIRWLSRSRTLLVGSASDESAVDGGGTGGDSVITPTTVRERPQTNYGSTDLIAPSPVGDVLLFTSRSAKKLRELVYDYQSDKNLAPDLLLLAKHLTRHSGIVQVAHQAEPSSTIWVARADGVLLGCTYLRDQNVVGWHRHETEGNVESVAVVPHPGGDRDQVWLSVRRIINGIQLRYIEYLDDAGWYYQQLHVDAAVTYDHTEYNDAMSMGALEGVGVNFNSSGPVFSPGDVGSEIRAIPLPGRALITAFVDTHNVTADIISPFTSLVEGNTEWAICPYSFTIPHLAGETLVGLVDGAVIPPVIADGLGRVTLAATGVLVELGLGYETLIESMPAEVIQLGTTAPLRKRTGEFFVKLFESLGCEVNGEQITFRRASDPLGVVTPLFTGNKKVRMRSGGADATVVIAQRQPLPLTVLFAALRFSVGA